MSPIASCPHCDEDVEISETVEVGEIVTCTNCDNDVEIISTEPLLLGEWDEEEK